MGNGLETAWPAAGQLCFEVDARNATLYDFEMIKSFAHKGLETFFTTGSKAGIHPAHASKLRRQLAQLCQAALPSDMNLPGWKLHPLQGADAGRWSVWVNGNWRLTFKFDGADACVVNYCDYH